MRKILGFLLALCALPALAQTSAVTATITDPDGTAWATLNGFNATWSAQLVNSTGQLVPQGQAVRIDTGASVTVTAQGTMDASGTFSATIVSSNNIRPAGTKWKFQVCPAVTSATCNMVTLPINASGTYSSQLSAGAVAPRIGGGIGNYAYTDAEVAAIPNNSYLNITTPAIRVYGTSWGSGGGTGGSCGTNNIPCTNTANTYTGTQSAPAFAGTTGAQTVLYMTQGTAAGAAPANTIRFGAPLSVPSSYDTLWPSAAPTDATGDVPVWPSGGGTATWQLPSNMVLISTQTVGTATAAVNFTSIPQQFHNLMLFVAGTATSGNTLCQLNFNGDVGTDYAVNAQVQAYSPTFTASGSFTGAGVFCGPMNNGAGGGQTTIFGYSSAITNKFYITSGIGWEYYNGSGFWGTITPITSIVATLANGTTWASGSVLSLYGVN